MKGNVWGNKYEGFSHVSVVHLMFETHPLTSCLRDNKTKADNKDDAEYDVAARELAFEGKGAAVDRTLGPEEFAERERQVCRGTRHLGRL